MARSQRTPQGGAPAPRGPGGRQDKKDAPPPLLGSGRLRKLNSATLRTRCLLVSFSMMIVS